MSSRTVFPSDVEHGIELKVWPGYGLTIDFLPLHAIVKQAWLGDPTHFVLSSNGNLCPQIVANQQGQNCTNTGASVVFLRQIQPIDFPGLLKSADGSTQLTLIVQQSDGSEKQYQFGLSPAQGKPEYTTLVFRPEDEKPVPLVPSAANNHNLSSTPQNNAAFPSTLSHLHTSAYSVPQPVLISNIPSSIDDANAVAFGLVVANQKGQIKPYTATWQRAQKAIALLRQGNTREQASQQAGVNMSILNQLIIWGQNRPH